MANWDEIKHEWETTKITLAKLAEKHDVPLGTIKSQKSRDSKNGNPWTRDATEKDATKTKKVATIEKQVGAPKGNDNAKGNRGNPNLTHEGKVIILRIPNRKLGELATKTLVHWVTLKTFMTRMLMTKEEKENGCFVVFNEPEQYQTDGLSKLMGRISTEGRKERLGSLYAFHHWNKLSSSLQENLQGGGVQQFLFMNDHTKTFDLSKHRFEDTIPIEEAHKLPAYHAIVSVRTSGELQPAFICKMAPPRKKIYNNVDLTKLHTKQFGRLWIELQELI
ncbi:hypothetical protein [Lysinibacillus sp. Y5S-8]|uniref:hypothetical protein n=1 Tax=Lysinibacillus sp. Y5S-8 TaxID=3122488 RepID=UPI0030CC77DB